MSASEVTEPQRFSLTLDPGLILERLILRRVAGLKRKRGHDWLRSLLVQGFLAEGRLILSECPRTRDGGSPQAPRVPATAFGSWLERANAPMQRTVEPGPRLRPVSPVPTTTRAEAKPFAHLRKVIG